MTHRIGYMSTDPDGYTLISKIFQNSTSSSSVSRLIRFFTFYLYQHNLVDDIHVLGFVVIFAKLGGRSRYQVPARQTCLLRYSKHLKPLRSKMTGSTFSARTVPRTETHHPIFSPFFSPYSIFFRLLILGYMDFPTYFSMLVMRVSRRQNSGNVPEPSLVYTVNCLHYRS